MNDKVENIRTEQDVRHIIEQCQQGDLVAFERLYKLFSRDVYTMALRMVNSPEVAEDVTQEVFISVYKNIQRFQFQSAFTTWLYRIIFRRAADYFRKAKKFSQNRISIQDEDSEDLISELKDTQPSPLERVSEKEKDEQVEKTIDALSPKQRVIVILRYSKHCSYEEIAKILNCRIGTVKSRLNRAHKTLEELLSKMDL